MNESRPQVDERRHADARNVAEVAPLRIGIVQPLIPLYRVPVFERLAATPGVRLDIWADMSDKGSLKAARRSSPASDAAAAPFAHHDAPWRMIGPFVSQPAARDAVRSGADVMILSGNARHLDLLPALRHCRRHGIATILWGHGYSKSESPLRRWWRHRVLRAADAQLLYNHAAARRLVADGFAPARIFVAPNSIDQTPIEHARRSLLDDSGRLDAFRREHGITRHELVVFISRLEPDKRVDLLLEAFVTVVAQRPSAKLALIGGGSASDALRARAAALGLGDRVIFTGPIYEENAMAPWCLAASCMAYPCAIGLSILHAFGYALPVITSDDIPSHNPEIEALAPAENGLLYRAGDVDDLAMQILRLFDDDALRRTLGQGALATVRPPGPFTLDRMIDGFHAAISGALALHGRRWSAPRTPLDETERR